MNGLLDSRDVADMLVAYSQMSDYDRMMNEYNAKPFLGRLVTPKPSHDYQKVFPSLKETKQALLDTLNAYLSEFNHNIPGSQFPDETVLTMKPEFDAKGNIVINFRSSTNGLVDCDFKMTYDSVRMSFFSDAHIIDSGVQQLYNRVAEKFRSVIGHLDSMPATSVEKLDFIKDRLKDDVPAKVKAELERNSKDLFDSVVDLEKDLQTPSLSGYCQAVNRQRQYLWDFQNGIYSTDNPQNVAMFHEMHDIGDAMLEKPALLNSISEWCSNPENHVQRPTLRELEFYTNSAKGSVNDFAYNAACVGYSQDEICSHLHHAHDKEVSESCEKFQTVFAAEVRSYVTRHAPEGGELFVRDIMQPVLRDCYQMQSIVDSHVRQSINSRLECIGDGLSDNSAVLNDIITSAYDNGIGADRLFRVLEHTERDGKPLLKDYEEAYVQAVIDNGYQERTLERIGNPNVQEKVEFAQMSKKNSEVILSKLFYMASEDVRTSPDNPVMAKDIMNGLGIKGESQTSIVDVFRRSRAAERGQQAVHSVFKSIKDRFALDRKVNVKAAQSQQQKL